MSHLEITGCGAVGGDESRTFDVSFDGTLKELIESLFKGSENTKHYLGTVLHLDIHEETEKANIAEYAWGKIKSKMPEFENRLDERVIVTGMYGGWGYYHCDIQFPDLFDYPTEVWR